MVIRAEHFSETGTAQSSTLDFYLLQTWPNCAPWGSQDFNEAKMIRVSWPLLFLILNAG